MTNLQCATALVNSALQIPIGIIENRVFGAPKVQTTLYTPACTSPTCQLPPCHLPPCRPAATSHALHFAYLENDTHTLCHNDQGFFRASKTKSLFAFESGARSAPLQSFWKYQTRARHPRGSCAQDSSLCSRMTPTVSGTTTEGSCAVGE